MGWGCYRHEIDADSDNWKKKVQAMLDGKGCHRQPFTWGRDGQVCPFCFDELERMHKIYSKALIDIINNPEGAILIATQAFEDCEPIDLEHENSAQDEPEDDSQEGSPT